MIPTGEIRIAPSVLAADLGSLAQAVGQVASTTNWLHLDVMDGHFVPNLTIGPPVVASLRRHTGAFFDCHLMMTNPGDYLQAFRDAGANLVSLHVEIGDTEALIAKARRLGLRVGIVANPDTPFASVAPFLASVDLLLLMTVFPGFGGQHFMAEVLSKIEEAHRFIQERGLPVTIEVDGGIDATTAPLCARAGASIFVAGNAVFGAEKPWEAVEEIRASVIGALDHRE